jgi:hypothetical protein
MPLTRIRDDADIRKVTFCYRTFQADFADNVLITSKPAPGGCLAAVSFSGSTEQRPSSRPGSLFPCPACDKPCKAHDFAEFTRRHLNFFQHHCYITTKIPRTDCDEHGVLRMTAPWAREGSRFTLLFEQAALMLVREMPVLAAARIIEITDKRLWRIVEHYVGRGMKPRPSGATPT